MDPTAFRDYFPVTKEWVYVNHAAVAPLSTQVQQAVSIFLEESVQHGYTAAPKWHRLIEQARQNVAQLVQARKEEIAFSPSTSAGLSYVAKGLKWQPGDNLLIPDCEFPANIYPWLNLEKQGVQVRRIPSQQGRLDLNTIQDSADSRTRLLSISSVQYGSGWQAPLEALGQWCRKNNILFCVDGIQSCGLLPMDVEKYQIDFLAADAHKWLLGPEGIAFFFCSKRVWDRVDPVLIGWKSVEHALDFDTLDFTLRKDAQKFEAGSDNVLGIHALNAAVTLLLQADVAKIKEHVFKLNDLLMEKILKNWPKAEIISPTEPDCRSGILAVKVPQDPVWLVDQFLKEGVYLASRKGWLRISPHYYNTEEEIEIITQTGKKLLR